jgi:hypothetical protein
MGKPQLTKILTEKQKMFKVNQIITNLIIIFFVFCLNSSVFSAGPCPPDCPGPTSTTPGDVGCNPNWSIKWAPKNPPEVERNKDIPIKFTGIKGPYDITVSGTGFWLDAQHTIKTIQNNETGEITLYADNSACGAATIDVTDVGCTNPITGKAFVKSTEGVWKLGVMSSRGGTDCDCPGFYETGPFDVDRKVYYSPAHRMVFHYCQKYCCCWEDYCLEYILYGPLAGLTFGFKGGECGGQWPNTGSATFEYITKEYFGCQ